MKKPNFKTLLNKLLYCLKRKPKKAAPAPMRLQRVKLPDGRRFHEVKAGTKTEQGYELPMCIITQIGDAIQIEYCRFYDRGSGGHYSVRKEANRIDRRTISYPSGLTIDYWLIDEDLYTFGVKMD